MITSLRVILSGILLSLAACSSSPVQSPSPPAPPQVEAPPEMSAGNSLGMAEPGTPPTLPRPRQLDIADDPALGAADAPVTIVEFLDYECPYCQRFAQDTFPLLKKHYIDTGKVRYIGRDFPLARHARARPAAIAAACAGEQGHYWEMRHALLEQAGRLRDEDIAAHTATLELDRTQFAACVADPKHAARLDADYREARALGVGATPSFLVGPSAGAVAQGRILQGDEDFPAFEAVLARYLPKP